MDLWGLIAKAVNTPSRPPTAHQPREPLSTGGERHHLIPQVRTVTRDGRTHTQTYWVLPEGAPAPTPPATKPDMTPPLDSVPGFNALLASMEPTLKPPIDLGRGIRRVTGPTEYQVWDDLMPAPSKPYPRLVGSYDTEAAAYAAWRQYAEKRRVPVSDVRIEFTPAPTPDAPERVTVFATWPDPEDAAVEQRFPIATGDLGSEDITDAILATYRERYAYLRDRRNTAEIFILGRAQNPTAALLQPEDADAARLLLDLTRKADQDFGVWAVQDAVGNSERHLRRASPETEAAVQKRLQDTHDTKAHRGFKLRLLAAYDLDYEHPDFDEEAERLGNVQHLYHGVGNARAYSVINTGLKPPHEVGTVTGAMFGSGMYFAEHSSKSGQYIGDAAVWDAQGEPESGILLECDVVTGNVYRATDHLPDGILSLDEDIETFRDFSLPHIERQASTSANVAAFLANTITGPLDTEAASRVTMVFSSHGRRLATYAEDYLSRLMQDESLRQVPDLLMQDTPMVPSAITASARELDAALKGIWGANGDLRPPIVPPTDDDAILAAYKDAFGNVSEAPFDPNELEDATDPDPTSRIAEYRAQRMRDGHVAAFEPVSMRDSIIEVAMQGISYDKPRKGYALPESVDLAFRDRVVTELDDTMTLPILRAAATGDTEVFRLMVGDAMERAAAHIGGRTAAYFEREGFPNALDPEGDRAVIHYARAALRRLPSGAKFIAQRVADAARGTNLTAWAAPQTEAYQRVARAAAALHDATLGMDLDLRVTSIRGLSRAEGGKLRNPEIVVFDANHAHIRRVLHVQRIPREHD